MEKKTLALFSVSAGAGHVRAAQAIEETAKLHYNNLNVIHLDLMNLVPKLFKKIYAESYIKIIKNEPALWGALYQKTDKVSNDGSKSKLRKFKELIESLNTAKFKSALKDINPDWIICTHFLPAGIISCRIASNKLSVPTWVQITDFDAHSLWIHPGLRGYLAANEETACRIHEKGIASENIKITGIPIMPVFSEKISRREAAAELGIDPDRKTILLMSGGEGLCGIDMIAERILHLDADFQILAMAGRNEKLFKKLQTIQEKHPDKLKPFGFTKCMEKFMAVSDLGIGKSGGLTTAESLASGLPLIVISPIPGQEERNADYLLENGAGMKAYDMASLEYKIKYINDNPQKLILMHKAALSLARPSAALDVLKNVIGERV